MSLDISSGDACNTGEKRIEYTCKLCSKSFASRNRHKHHKQRQHPRTTKKNTSDADEVQTVGVPLISSSGSGSALQAKGQRQNEVRPKPNTSKNKKKNKAFQTKQQRQDEVHSKPNTTKNKTKNKGKALEEPMAGKALSYKQLCAMRRAGTHDDVEKLDMKKLSMAGFVLSDQVCKVCLNSATHTITSIGCPYLYHIANADKVTVGEGYEVVCKHCSMPCAHAEHSWEGRAFRRYCHICWSDDHWSLECPKCPARVESYFKYLKAYLLTPQDVEFTWPPLDGE